MMEWKSKVHFVKRKQCAQRRPPMPNDYFLDMEQR